MFCETPAAWLYQIILRDFIKFFDKLNNYFFGFPIFFFLKNAMNEFRLIPPNHEKNFFLDQID